MSKDTDLKNLINTAKANKAGKPERKILPPRLTVVDKCYYQQPNKSAPTLLESGYTKHLKSNEQLYSREIQVSEEWQELDIGWVKTPAQFFLSNNEGLFPDKILSEEEKNALTLIVVELSFSKKSEESWLIGPGECHRGWPLQAKLFARCRKGTANCTVSAIPE